MIFQPLLPTDFLVETKIKTNDLEEKWAESNGCRRLNIDPGYFCLENLILATSKNFTHRIHLGKGIFADLTLIYTKGDYQPNPWTFRDYSEPKVRDFFKQARSGFHAQLKEQI